MEFKDDWERAEYEYIQCLNRYEVAEAKLEEARRVLSVSYTHLTLPTIYSV